MRKLLLLALLIAVVTGMPSYGHGGAYYVRRPGFFERWKNAINDKFASYELVYGHGGHGGYGHGGGGGGGGFGGGFGGGDSK